LFEALQQKASEMNALALSSDVSITARPFFEKMGFEMLNEQNNPTRGVNLTNYRMKKMLT